MTLDKGRVKKNKIKKLAFDQIGHACWLSEF